MFGLEYRKQTNIVDFLSKLQIPIAMGNFISINFDLIKNI
jgi:hypothetical protein